MLGLRSAQRAKAWFVTTAGHGFKITKWPAVQYFSQIYGIEGTHSIETMIC